MANYKELEGFGVQTLASDPTEARLGRFNLLQFYREELLKQLNLVV
jgi:hypothetical protein